MASRCINHLLFSTALLCSGNLMAAGYAVQEQSVSGLGTAFAGAAVSANDASVLWGNSAALAKLNGRQISGAGHAILPTAEFDNQGSTLANGNPISGGSSETTESALVPNIYYSAPINDQMTFGFGINAPFGLTTKYDSDWVGRYHAIKSFMSVINFNPALGYKVNDTFSIGGGISIVKAGVQLTNKVDFGGRIDPTLSEQYDVLADFGAEGWGVGFQLAMLFEPTDKVRVGLNYRSKINLTLKGDADFDVPSNIPAFAVASANQQFRDGGIEASNTLPETLSLGLGIDVSPRWELLSDISWTKWSRFYELRIEYDDDREDSVQPENWDNALRFAIGSQFKYNDKMTYRFGFSVEQTPIPDAEHRTPRIPDDDRTWLTFGLTRKLSNTMTLDAAYGLVSAGDTAIKNRDETTDHLLDGEYSSNVHILSAALNWKF